MRPPVTPFVLLIRHADAGDASSWPDEDWKRPLSDRGHAQAKALALDIGEWPIGPLISSPAVRCVETLGPLAEARSTPTEVAPWLAEGSGDSGLDRLLARSDEGVGVCTHGDVLPILLIRLAEACGIDLEDEPTCSKGSFWLVELGDKPRARYRARRA